MADDSVDVNTVLATRGRQRLLKRKLIDLKMKDKGNQIDRLMQDKKKM